MSDAPPGAPSEDTRGTETEPAERNPLRHVRWLLPVAVALTIGLGVSLAMALQRTSSALGTTPVGFFTPRSTKPVRFTLPVLGSSRGGRTVGLDTLLSRHQPLVVNMWTSSCTECQTETPALEAMAKKLAGKVQFVGIDMLDQRGPGLAFVRRYHVTYTQLFDPNEFVGQQYGIPGFPVTVFISASGKVVGENLGALDPKSITHYLSMLFGVHA